MKKKIFRNYLEIKSLNDLKEVVMPSDNLTIEIAKTNDFQQKYRNLFVEKKE